MKAGIVILLLMLVSTPTALAQPRADGIGRLFTTPQQRAQLDRQRLQNPTLLPSGQNGESSLTINGEIRRSNGRATRWINGELNETTGTPRLAVGDTYHPATGEQETLLRGGRIVIQPGSR